MFVFCHTKLHYYRNRVLFRFLYQKEYLYYRGEKNAETERYETDVRVTREIKQNEK